MSSSTSRAITLRDGEMAVVDAEDFDRISQYQWRLCCLGYVVRYIGHQSYQYLHRFILREPATRGQRVVIDHINRDRRDNRKSNLRRVSKSENSLNGGLSKRNKSSRRGISRCGQMWRARVRIEGVNYELGRFSTIAAAAVARKSCLEKNGMKG